MEVCSGDGPFHGCVYSRSIDQEYPRKCAKCGISEQAVDGWLTKVMPEEFLKPKMVLLADSQIKNMSLLRHEKSCINVYDKDCIGCQTVGADFMLTVGSTVDVLGGNNQTIGCEGPKHVDIFITEKQALGLLEQLQKKVKRDKPAPTIGLKKI